MMTDKDWARVDGRLRPRPPEQANRLVKGWSNKGQTNGKPLPKSA